MFKSTELLRFWLLPESTFDQGCQVVYFYTKNYNLDIFWKMLAHFMTILNISWPFGMFCGHFGKLCQENLATLHATF
jgi:hypothetical protein